MSCKVFSSIETSCTYVPGKHWSQSLQTMLVPQTFKGETLRFAGMKCLRTLIMF